MIVRELNTEVGPLKAVLLDFVENGWKRTNYYYCQNRIVKEIIADTRTCDKCEYEVLVDYAVIPECDNMLKRFE